MADRDGSNPRQIFRDIRDKHNHYLAWGIDENWIYFVNGTPATSEMDLWRISAAGGTPERLTTQNSDMRDPTPLRNGMVLYIAREHDRSGPWLWSFDLAHKVSHRIAFGLEQYTSLSASSNGERLAVTVSNPTVRLWSIPIRDTIATEADVKPFPPDSRRAVAPRFRGSALYYLASIGLTRRNGKSRLRLITADGTESREIAPELDVEGSEDWSPDGRWIVTGGNDGGGEGLFKIPATGGAPVRLTKTIGRNPVWSPDGSMIAYSGPNVFTLEPLLMIRPDGTLSLGTPREPKPDSHMRSELAKPVKLSRQPLIARVLVSRTRLLQNFFPKILYCLEAFHRAESA